MIDYGMVRDEDGLIDDGKGCKLYLLQNASDIQLEKGFVSIDIVVDKGVLFGGGWRWW